MRIISSTAARIPAHGSPPRARRALFAAQREVCGNQYGNCRGHSYGIFAPHTTHQRSTGAHVPGVDREGVSYTVQKASSLERHGPGLRFRLSSLLGRCWRMSMCGDEDDGVKPGENPWDVGVAWVIWTLRMASEAQASADSSNEG